MNSQNLFFFQVLSSCKRSVRSKSRIIYDNYVGSCCYEIKTLLIMIEWLIDQRINFFYR
jgi:hypothetical protein